MSYNGKNKKETTLTRRAGVSVKLFLWNIFSFSRAKPWPFKPTYFSLFIFRMSEDKKLVHKPSLTIKLISNLFRKPPRKEVILQRRERSRETLNTGVSYTSFVFEKFLLIVSTKMFKQVRISSIKDYQRRKFMSCHCHKTSHSQFFFYGYAFFSLKWYIYVCMILSSEFTF